MAPSPALFLSAATQRTRRIRLGPLVYLLPLYDPLRLIEEVAMLDQLSGGRLELGVGRDVSPYELRNFGVDPENSRAMFDEALAVLLAGLTRERLSFAGAHYQYPDVPIELHPLPLCCTDQQPGAVSPPQRHLREANVLRPAKLEHAVQQGGSNGHLGRLPASGP
jgi:alkanesulfonate monooxygenase SsuD/methylene tetrahydromethanopterin reductase-like flavin-dependent oxidoreductase (luciferase family)